MIAAKIDLIAAKHPRIAELMKERIYTFYDTGILHNAAICAVSWLTAGMLAGLTDSVLPVLSLIVTVIVWAQVSLLAGFLKQWAFIPIAAVIQMLPHMLYLYPDSAALQEAGSLQITLSDISYDILLAPVRTLSEPFTQDIQTASAVIFLVFAAVFLIGTRIRSKAKRSDFYCRTRLEQL